ncbi:AAA family ATPase [Paenibacillus alginolyticus]|uniref:ATP-dependent nuclease n=1 Tax=Paenibacillus alginolyticus TaxID=59839 RepID=UPI00040919EC|nr:AAA family ATPase [Paenibacillus alginolyticus]MCY9670673.1 AAA family ATPase [Paenibacillus alginolyticus]
MRLKRFSVTNYKVFCEKFSINFSQQDIAILTGKNNTGKSTFLEAINQFYLPTVAKTKIPVECYSDQDESKVIELEAVFLIDGEELTILKRYANDSGKYFDQDGKEIKKGHILKTVLDKLLENSPYYITPYMTTDEVDKQVQEIYSHLLTAELTKLENDESDLSKSKQEYLELKRAIPKLLSQLKSNTDQALKAVSDNVSKNLQGLFSNKDLQLAVSGGDSNGFSIAEIVKSTNSSVTIDNKQFQGMPLSTQGTGIQRMSLIFIFQNMIEQGMLGINENKMLLIDEPEAFLHPEAVRALSQSLYTIGGKMPLIISTHSPVLIDLSENHTSIQVLRIGSNEAIELFQSSNSVFDENDITNMKILNYVDSYINEFFFANNIIIVEGDTEYIALKHYIKEKELSIHVIRARGKSTICTLMKILNQFKAPYYILHDMDNNNTKYEQKTLKAQLTNCKNIFKLKQENNTIFASVANFEQAIGIVEVPDRKKTSTIYGIMNDPSGVTVKNRIYSFFDHIFDIRKSDKLEVNIIEILYESVYEELFMPVVGNEHVAAGAEEVVTYMTE